MLFTGSDVSAKGLSVFRSCQVQVTDETRSCRLVRAPIWKHHGPAKPPTRWTVSMAAMQVNQAVGVICLKASFGAGVCMCVCVCIPLCSLL